MAYRGTQIATASRKISDETPRIDLYAEVTAKIIAQLEAGIAPWACPWNKSGGSLSLPVSMNSNKAYSGNRAIFKAASAAQKAADFLLAKI